MRSIKLRPIRRPALIPAAALAIIPAVLLITGQASASGEPSHHQAPATTGSARLYGVSCKATFCMAIGSYPKAGANVRLVEAWNGRTWRDVRDPLRGELFNVTCGSATFCFALRRNALVEWNGRTWLRFTNRTSPGAVIMSCGSPKMCAALVGSQGSYTEIDQWNGKTWNINPESNFCTGAPPGPSCGYGGTIDCGGRSNCMAPINYCVSTACSEGVQYDYEAWNGSNWGDIGNSPYNFAPQPACSWGTFCMVTDHSTQASIWQVPGPGWQDASPDLAAICRGAPHCDLFGSLSCGAPQACVQLNAGPLSLIWSDFTWKAAPLALVHGVLPKFSQMSCGSATNCMAVGSYGKSQLLVAEHWNGAKWQLTKPTTS